MEAELVDECYVKNSSFLSRDIEAKRKESPPKVTSPPVSTFKTERVVSFAKLEKCGSKEKNDDKDCKTDTAKVNVANKIDDKTVKSVVNKIEPAKTEPQKKTEGAINLSKEAVTKASNKFETKLSKLDNSKVDDPTKELQMKLEKLAYNEKKDAEKTDNDVEAKDEVTSRVDVKKDESNGVGDKIKKFEKAVENANATTAVNTGKLSRPGSIRRKLSQEVFSENHQLPEAPKVHHTPYHTPNPPVPHHQNTPLTHHSTAAPPGTHYTHSVAHPAPNTVHHPQNNLPTPHHTHKSDQKIIKPEFKHTAPAIDATIRSPSLGAKTDFPSHGTAFRNVAQNSEHKSHDDKPCKFKEKKYSISKGSSYFGRGAEDIWLVKKKDILEIEERVFDSLGRGNTSDTGHNASMSHTMGRHKRQMYSRSESLDPQWAGARSQTLKRQSSVACTCGHDKNKQRSKSSCESTRRDHSSRQLRDLSLEDDASARDKYETLV